MEGCELEILAKSMCRKHYHRMRKHGTLVLPPRKLRKKWKDGSTKICPDCSELKPIAEFYCRKEYANSYCKPCWRKRARDQQLLRKYGISRSDYEAMLEQQGNCCAICGCHESENEVDSKLSRPRKLAVDHCHVTGKVRGLLCSTCNKCLGMAKDSPTILRKAAMYVENRGAQ